MWIRRDLSHRCISRGRSRSSLRARSLARSGRSSGSSSRLGRSGARVCCGGGRRRVCLTGRSAIGNDNGAEGDVCCTVGCYSCTREVGAGTSEGLGADSCGGTANRAIDSA